MVRHEEFSKQHTVSNYRPVESRPAGDRAVRDYYFSNRQEGQHLNACAETNVNPAQAINKKLMAFLIS